MVFQDTKPSTTSFVFIVYTVDIVSLLVAVIPVEVYEQVIAEREARFQVLDRIRSRGPDVSAGEVAQDVAEAIEAVRATHAQGRT